MTEKKFKVGDEVRITRTWKPGEKGTDWGRDPLIMGSVGQSGKITAIKNEGEYDCCVVKGQHIHEWAFPDFVLELV